MNPVTVEVLATFGVNFNPVSRVGWYVAGSPNARNEVFTVNPNTGGNNNHQSLNPLTTGLNSFNPGAATFGLYSFWPPAIFNWTVFSEDGLNTFEPDVVERHKVRVYPLRNASGIVPNAYIVATEEFTSGFDYNDVVYIIRNVEPATLNPGGNINFTNLDWVTLNAQSIPQFDYLNTWLTFHRILNPNPAKPIQVHDRVTLRITNTGTDPLVITNIQFSNNTQWNLPNGENPSVANPLVIQPNAFYDLVVRFIETQGTRGVRIGTMTITSSDPDQPTSVINLAGAFMLADEGGFENTPPQISQSLGFQNNLAYPFNSQYIARGEEVLSFDWRRADPTRPVYVRQLAAFHGCCNAEAFFRVNGPGGATMRHDNTQAQTILPLRQAAGNPTLPTEMVVYPTGNPFTMTAEGFDSDDCRNVANCRQNGLRFWPVRGPNGVLIPNAYYIIQDYIPGNGCEINTPGGICDYNDNIYLVTNVEPFTTVTDVAVTITPPTAPATNANLAYIVNTSNVSAFQAANVVTTITIPAGYTIVSAVPAVGTCGAPVNNVVTCNFGTLTGNGQAAVEIIVTTATPGDYTVQAAVTTTTAETELLNNQTVNMVTVVAQTTIANTLTIVKQASPDSAQAFQFNTVGAGLTNFQLIDNGGAATPLNVSVNFQPAAAPVPANFIADTGAAYGARGGGRTYGWLAEGNDQPINAAINTRDRNRVGIPQELDTMIHMQYTAGGNGGLPNTPIYWEYALPNGMYNVTVSVGDQPSYDSQHRIYVEGQVIPNINPFQANAANEYRQGTISVIVTDGRLTLSAFDNNGQNSGVNTKINYVRISQANQQTFTNLAAGQYTITEVVPANWTLLGATCTGATFVGVQNGVTVTLAGNQNVVCTFNNTSATGAAIALDKTAVTTPINAGGTALFNIVITNIGLVDLNTVTLSDPQCTTGPTRTNAGNNDAQNILSPLESWTYTCAIANSFTDVTNTATVTANPVGGGQAVTATDTATVAVNPLPSISLTKIAENSPVTTGANALFTLRATNTGNVALTNIILTDALCTTLVQTANGNGDATLDVGEFWTWTCTVNNVSGMSLAQRRQRDGTPRQGSR
ncbi:hypothetical protein HC928_19700 [bacterium]|nr:hypothetical protein [bacterium]